MGFWDIFLGALFLVICFLLIVVVLLQKGRGGGLGAAFGGMGSSAFGTRTGDVFTWVTIVLTGLFLVLAVATSLVYRPAPKEVFTPTFLPEPGPISERSEVRISCMTRGSLIYYTINGKDPDEKSTLYSPRRAVLVEPGMVLKARAYRQNWDESEVAVGNYPPADANQLPKPSSRPADANAPGGVPGAPGGPASAPAKN